MERLEVKWLRPDEEEAVAVTFTYPNAKEASDVLERILVFLSQRVRTQVVP